MPGSASNANLPKRNAKLANADRHNLLWCSIVILATLLADQATKLWAVNNLQRGQSQPVLGDFLQFTLIFNEGGAMGTNFGSPTYYLVASSIVLVFLLWYLWSHRNHLAVAIPLSLIAGGAAGNIIDRIRYGEVIDFIDMDFFDITIGSFHLERWWAFNIADMAISVSIVYLVFIGLFGHIGHHEHNEHDNRTPEDQSEHPDNHRPD
jgi:signal peptidase II